MLKFLNLGGEGRFPPLLSKKGKGERELGGGRGKGEGEDKKGRRAIRQVAPWMVDLTCTPCGEHRETERRGRGKKRERGKGIERKRERERE